MILIMSVNNMIFKYIFPHGTNLIPLDNLNLFLLKGLMMRFCSWLHFLLS